MLGKRTFSSDRLVEGLHAYNKHYLTPAPNAKAVHVAFFAVAQGIREVLAESPDVVERLSDHSSKVRHIRSAIVASGFGCHASVKAYLEGQGARKQRGMHRAGRKYLIDLLYHVDRANFFVTDLSPWKGLMALTDHHLLPVASSAATMA